MNQIFAEIGTSVFERMSHLAREHQAINLGQGFPDDPGPHDVRAKAAEAVMAGWNQYPPMMGIPELRGSISRHYKRFQDLDLDPEQEIMVTSGATEALAGALMALIQPGDEVVLFQPMYDAYLPLVKRAGGVPRYITLRPPRWTFDETDLEAVVTPRTRVVLFNNPLNPAGAVYDKTALAPLASFCIRHKLIAICDEVWEHIIFDERGHTPLIALEGMRERSVKIGSAGKIFSLTGWKVGFVCAAPALMKLLARAHQFITFATPPNLQSAVAYGLMKDDSYFVQMRSALQRSRDRFSNGLIERGFRVLPSAATYFLNVDVSSFGTGDDVEFCNNMVSGKRVAAIPVSAFYSQDPVRSIVRFCFAKSDLTLDTALARLDSGARSGRRA
jgi:N-succinyldiaminopimelate aminotransferase